ncbi:hypothetical protein [Microbacterium tumbae]
MARRTSVGPAAGKWLLGGAVVVLAIVAIVLALLALDRVNTPPEDGDVAPVPTFAQSTPQSPSPAPSETAVSVAPIERPQERFIAVGSGALWRGTAGACGTVAPLLERSTDGGETWDDVTPDYLEIGQLSRVDAFAGDQAQIVASMGDGCEVQSLRTFTQGQFWESYPEVLTSSEYLDPTNAGRVVLAVGEIAAPCAEARNLRSSGDLVTVVCDGTAYLLDADASWQALPASGVVALAVDDVDVIAAHVDEACAGIALTRYIGADASTAQDAGCVAEADVSAPTAIAAEGEDVLVWSDESWTRIDG